MAKSVSHGAAEGADKFRFNKYSQSNLKTLTLERSLVRPCISCLLCVIRASV
jgi:hypothetical protein